MKPKPKSKSTKLSPSEQKARKVDQSSAKSINSLYSRSRTALEQGELVTAHDLASRACTLLPKDSPNVHPIELLGEIKIEMGEIEQARECFLEAVRRKEGGLETELGEEGKFLWLGQLSSEEEAEKWYLRGVDVLVQLLGSIDEEEKKRVVREKISEVYCSLIELYLTDLCLVEKAEEMAEKYALLALQSNPESPTALSLLASIRLSQTRVEDATSLLQQSLSKWLGVHGAIIPPYAERINLVKLLIEIELYSEALEVLQTMEREDEENVELWYLYTCAYYHDTNESKDGNWKSAKECAEMCLKLYQRMEWDDEELKNSCQEILSEIKKSGLVSEDAEWEQEEDTEEEQWESEDDEEAEGEEDMEMVDAH